MSDGKTFAVTVIGIPEQERNVLKNIFKLSLYRAYTYTLVSVDEPGQILMVDADDPSALAEWRAWRGGDSASQSSPPKSPIPTVLVTKEPPANSTAYSIRRPFIATRVLGVLDQVAAQAPSTAPERIIGESAPVSAPAEEPPPAPIALVVDDSSTIRKQMELELKLLGVRVDAVESGEQAFEALARKNYDLIFLDVVLPGADGYQICKTIKKDKIRKKIPVIMLTSKSSPFDRVKGALAGCDTYLTKPAKQSVFQKTVKKYLKIP
ncbi:MAG: response regulator [Candidatus Contendobacter sp.]|nr:response regulator [Candidatus Contendobacter sp.]MDS4057905.1 response regulator [Candidatus Contendobacter sp.]